MIRITKLKIPYDKPKRLDGEIRRILGIFADEEYKYTIRRKSIDTRNKKHMVFVYTVDVDIKDEERFSELVVKGHSLSYVNEPVFEPYFEPTISNAISGSNKGSHKGTNKRPVVCGFGPAGIFAGYILAKNNVAPIIIERGESMDERVSSVDAFFEKNSLNPSSNVCFGEGGAGTFSDGKLNTGVKDALGCGTFVLRTLVDFGAPSDILYEARPHLGTDKLRKIIPRIRDEIISLGGEVRFNTTLTDILTRDGKITHIITDKGDTIPVSSLILAIGHSARDTYEMLYKKGLNLLPKSFSVGYRIEHPQELIDRMTYGKKRDKFLPAASYKISCTDKIPGRGIYSFCMCPGGYVVNSSTEDGRLCVNGMSYSGRSSGNANSAIAVSVSPKDFASQKDNVSYPLSGIAFQREIEQKAFAAGHGYIPQQLYSDYKNGIKSTTYGSYDSCVKGRAVLSNLRGILPTPLEEAFMVGMKSFSEKWFKEFAGDDVILSGIEGRTSSPVRITRNEGRTGSIEGIYPCGEGAGYAGGITSAAMDGILCAMALLKDDYGR